MRDMAWPLSYFQRKKKIARARRAVQAAYYSATSDSSSMDFSFASGVDMQDVLKSDLNTLRNRIRYELRQNGPAKGICRSYANSCISTGPCLSIECDPEYAEWGEETEFQFSEWAKKCGYIRGESLAELLHCGVRQFFNCGEYFVLNKFDSSVNTPIKLRLLQIRPDRVTSPYTSLNNSVIDGVEFDPNGKPIAYHIENAITQFAWTREPSKNVRHVFYQESPEQVRGEPWLASGLSDLHKRRRYDEARVAAAIVAAKFAIFLVNNDPSIEVNPRDLLPEGVIEINDGAATVLPPHYGIESFSGAQPVAGATDFRREMIANAGAAVGMAANASNQDSSSSNFASSRYDDVGLGLEHDVVRNLIANRDLTPLVEKWITEASAVRAIGIPPNWYRLVWRWPHANRHTDPQKAASADEKRVVSGIASKSEIWAEHGLDRERARADLLDDVAWHRKNGLVHPIDAKAQAQKTKTENTGDRTNEQQKNSSTQGD
jgi:lambda family phage portal protein